MRNECVDNFDCDGNASTCVYGVCHCDTRYLHGHRPYKCVPGLEFPVSVMTSVYFAVLVFCVAQMVYMCFLEGSAVHVE